MRITEKLANRIILIAVSFIILLFLLFSNSSKFLLYAFSNDVQYNLDYIKEEYDKNIFQKERLITAYGWLADKLGIKEINNLVKYDGIAYFMDNEIMDIEQKSSAISALSRKANGRLAFVLLPSPIMSDYERFNSYFFTNTYNDVKSFIDSLSLKGVSVYDLSRYNNDKALGYRYLRSDHHWRPEFAFEFMSPIVDIYKEFYPDSDAKPYYYDISNYSIETHKNLALGSYGKRVGHKFLMPDDFSIITPKYKSNFIVKSNEVKGRELVRGDFDKVFIARNYIDYDYMNIIAYKAYAGDIAKKMHSHNLNPAIKGKLLILMDSYSYPLSVFLCNIFEDVYTVDLRYHSDSIYQKIDEIEPDLVLMLYSHYALDYPELFMFNQSN